MEGVATFLIYLLTAANVFAGGTEFLDQVFKSTGTVLCVEEEAERHALPLGDGIRIGKNTNSFPLIWLQINVVCTGMGNARQLGSWAKFWNREYGSFRAAPFEAGGDFVLIVHFLDLQLLFTKSTPSGEPPKRDWTMPEASKKRNA